MSVGIVVRVILSQPDEWGRVRFWQFCWGWFAFVRGQMFFAEPAKVAPFSGLVTINGRHDERAAIRAAEMLITLDAVERGEAPCPHQ